MHRTTRRFLPVFMTGLLTLACAIASVTADAAGATPLRPGGVVGGPRIVNGTLTSQYPSVGALLSPANPNIAGLVCSGTLIGCQTFLTAAHCVCDVTGAQCQSGPNAPNPADYVVFFQHAGFFAVSAVQVRPDFAFPIGDVAVLTLATPVTGIAPTPIDVTDAPGAGTSATIVGFGRNAGAEDYGLKRTGAVSMAPCVAGISNTTSVCWDFSDPLGPPGTDSDTCNGDSGGPLFAAFHCGDTVAGITSGGTSGSCTPADHSYDANVFHYRDYIQTHAGTLGGTCGAMPQAGEASAPIVAASGALSSGVPQASHTIDVPVGTTSLRVALNASEDFSADFDLYVKAGSPPTTSDYDCKADGPNQYGFCEIAAPTPGTWYALVRRAQSSGTYQLTATTFASGAPGSGFEGQSCDDGNACTESETCQAGACIGSAVANGAPCDDGTACTGPDVCQAGVCDSTPTLATSCIEPVLGGKASLSLKHGVPSSRNQLAWRWVKGDTTTLADFGDPTSSAGYELCVFDESGGVPQLALHAAIPGGAGWTPKTRGYRYRDVTLQHDGMRTLVLKDGPAGGASIAVSAKGSRLDVPTLPLDQDATVTVQLRGANACFQARYSTNVRNDTQQFKARGD
jgi:hypothetical protein